VPGRLHRPRVNRRVAAVRGLFEFLVMRQGITASPVPAPRRSSGLRPVPRGLLGHLGPGRRRSGGRLVRQESRLPQSLPPADVAVFLSDLRSHRDRAVVLLMLLSGLWSAEVRGLLLRDVDMGRRRVRVVGKGGKERVVPVDGVFFAELGAYLRLERPPGLATAQCFVVLCGPTTGAPLSEAGLRSLFRRHRDSSGQLRVRPHRSMALTGKCASDRGGTVHGQRLGPRDRVGPRGFLPAPWTTKPPGGDPFRTIRLRAGRSAIGPGPPSNRARRPTRRSGPSLP